jgi:hypothetical protein
MAEAVYILCALTSMSCAWLLWRRYLANRTQLLLWSSVCFLGLAINNVILFADLMIVPDTDLSMLRHVTALLALSAFVYGLIVESD